MNGIERIGFRFTNSEYFEFEQKDIGYFKISGIEETCLRTADNHIEKIKQAKKCCIQLLPSGNRKYEENIEYNVNFDTKSVYDRIRATNDIVSIVLVYEDGTSEFITTYWSEESKYGECFNCAQATSITDDSLFIAITKKIAKRKYYSADTLKFFN